MMLACASLFNSPFSIPIFVVGFIMAGAAVISVGTTAAVQIRKARVAAYDARLKQLMIERGMTADEIAMVLQARSYDDDDEDDDRGGRRRRQGPVI